MKWKELLPWQKKKLLHWFLFFTICATAFIGGVCIHMNLERSGTGIEYAAALANDADSEALKQQLSGQAAVVTAGTYVENVKEISLKNCNFRVSFLIWFKWEGHPELNFTGDEFRIYNAVINKKEVLHDYEKNGLHYQQMRMDATISKSFDIARFPLGSQVLKFYIEPNQYTVNEVVFVPDTANSGVNKNLHISGYELLRSDVAEHTIVYPNTMSNPKFEMPRTVSELVTVMEINRTDWGLYMKCFIALVGTTVWVFMVLYVCANHKVNPLGTIPAALFGTVGNLMVGANLLPDMVRIGLVEYVNLFGVMIVLAGALSIININRIREQKENSGFAKYYGRVMFYTLLVLCLAGQIIIPASAYMWGK